MQQSTPRYLEKLILTDLKTKMVFISGPRQCGKTTLSQAIAAFSKKSEYLTWDDSQDRKRIKNRDWSDDCELVILDELHKYSLWKNWLKGLYDKTSAKTKYLVTGSARMDVYKRGGDSMFGRYWPWRLHPLCLAEQPLSITSEEALTRLLTVGGFPEPYLNGDLDQAARWRNVREDLLLRIDLRDLSRIEDLSQIENLLALLRSRVGGPTVISNLAEDLDSTHPTVKNWLAALEALYLVFAVKPYSGRLTRSIKKPAKYYFYDNAEVSDAEGMGARFENLVATHLLKRLQFFEDSKGEKYELRYVRDREQHEVDFLILKDRKPLSLIEVKWKNAHLSPSLLYFQERLNVPHCLQIVREPMVAQIKQGVHICSAGEILSRPLTEKIWEILS